MGYHLFNKSMWLTNWYANNECLWVQWYKHFHEVKGEMVHSTREAKLNGIFHLSPHENICSIAQMRKHSLFVLNNLYKDSNIETNLKLKVLKNDFSWSKNILQATRRTLPGKYYVDACITLNALTAPAAFALHRVLHILFLMCCAFFFFFFFFTKISYALCNFFFFLIELSPHTTPTHRSTSTSAHCRFMRLCVNLAFHVINSRLFVEKLLLLRQFDNCND